MRHNEAGQISVWLNPQALKAARATGSRWTPAQHGALQPFEIEDVGRVEQIGDDSDVADVKMLVSEESPRCALRRTVPQVVDDTLLQNPSLQHRRDVGPECAGSGSHPQLRR